MGVDQPFMYDHPTKYSFLGPADHGFNPRSATQASWTPRQPRPKPEGPLIQSKEFNRHPDSYFVVPYGNLNAKAMSPRTKSKVKWTRMVQLFLRICALLGALGMLVCVICIKGTEAVTGWIIRVPPAVAILHTIYAIYHLSRSSKGRTPTSSASYMVFAAIMDAGLVPFLVFTALVCRNESLRASDAQGHWKTLFNDDLATYQIVKATFLLSVTNGGIHFISLILSIYLGVIYRKIARLPPDMNPLEDNLTSRHKHKKSDMSQATTAIASKRESKVEEPLISPVRNVPFMHTRNSSHANINNIPSPTFSPRSSRIDVSDRPASQAPSVRTSRTYFPALNQQHQQPPARQPTIPTLPPAQTDLKRSPTKASSVYSTATATSQPLTEISLSDNNWITHSNPSPSPSPSPPRELNFMKKKSNYHPLTQISPFEYGDENRPPPVLPQPLSMNPPSPPIDPELKRGYVAKPAVDARTLTPATGNWGPPMVGIGKARQWGAQGGGGGRVVSRSGVEISQGGILPNGGVRAREVSGKVMEEGRGNRGAWR